MNSFHSVPSVSGVKLLSKLRLNFINPNQHKFRHVFKNITNCTWDSDSTTGTTLHLLLQCQQYQKIRLELLNSIYNLNPKIRDFYTLLYEPNLYTFEINNEIIKLTEKFLKTSKRFERPHLRPVLSLPPQLLRTNLITFFLKFLIFFLVRLCRTFCKCLS